MRFSKDQFETFKACANAQELIGKAKEQGVELDEAKAKVLLDSVEFAELNEDELELAGAAADCPNQPTTWTCQVCNGSFDFSNPQATLTRKNANTGDVDQLKTCSDCYNAKKNQVFDGTYYYS